MAAPKQRLAENRMRRLGYVRHVQVILPINQHTHTHRETERERERERDRERHNAQASVSGAASTPFTNDQRRQRNRSHKGKNCTADLFGVTTAETKKKNVAEKIGRRKYMSE